MRNLLAFLSVCAACIAPPLRGYPLYTASVPPNADRVSMLAGYVARVDGRDVTSLGGTFELLPGCHLVETPTKWSKGSGTYGVLVATTGPLTFVLWMTPGHRYEVKVEAEMPTGPTGTAFVRTEEMTARGDPVRFIGPVRRGQEAELVTCADHQGVNNYPRGN